MSRLAPGGKEVLASVAAHPLRGDQLVVVFVGMLERNRSRHFDWLRNTNMNLTFTLHYLHDGSIKQKDCHALNAVDF